MKFHEATLAIPAKEMITYGNLMSKSVVDLDKERLPHMANIKTWSVEFDNGNVFDLRVNTSDDDVWSEGIFFANNDNAYSEMYIDDVRDTLTGYYTFTDEKNDEKYVVYVVVEETLKGKEQKMVKYLITDILWDVDEDEDFDSLPQRITVNVSKDKNIDDIEKYLSEMITDKYGFCHNGFAYDEI